MSNTPIVFIATPMYGGMSTGTYTSSIMQTPIALSQNGIGMYYAHMMNESLIPRARNKLTHDFLESPATHLMWIDADIGFNPNDIVSMVKADENIICGLYPKKEINWPRVAEAVKQGVPPAELSKHVGSFVVNLVPGVASEAVDPTKKLEISNGGTGFMLIKREVFEVLADKVPQYMNDMHTATDTEKQRYYIKEFYDCSIDPDSGNRLLSEDYHFCKIARDAGFKIYAAPWVHLSHTGTYIFDGTLQVVKP
jgi:hypothetical protein